MRRLVIAAALMMAGCQTASENATPPALTSEAVKRLVLSEKARIWKDPMSIQSAQIGQPYTCSGGLAHVGMMPNACVCVEVNAKNGFGGYTGAKRTEILLNGTTIVDMLPPREPTYSCGVLSPFPELNGDYVPTSAIVAPAAAPRQANPVAARPMTPAPAPTPRT